MSPLIVLLVSLLASRMTNQKDAVQYCINLFGGLSIGPIGKHGNAKEVRKGMHVINRRDFVDRINRSKSMLKVDEICCRISWTFDKCTLNNFESPNTNL